MIRSADGETSVTSEVEIPRASDSQAVSGAPSLSPYGRAFWWNYLASTALMVAVSLLYRFADFVSVLGGGELELGFIVGVGMVGSLFTRLAQGVGLDRYGCRRVWLWSLAILVVVLAAHTQVTTSHSPAIYVLQILYRTAAAGAYGASITYISLSVNISRMAEAVGLLGTSGFVGMILGPILGDWLLGTDPSDRAALNEMFLAAAFWCLIAWVAAWLATQGDLPPPPRRQPPLWGVLRRYHPGIMLLMGIIMGMGIGLPNTFVRPFAAELRIERIALFFTVYSVAAFATRIATRRMADVWGARLAILLSMTLMIVGTLAYIPVRTDWQLAIPAALSGISHALIFPAVMVAGSATFPNRYRGLGNAVILAMYDLGVLIGAPLAGSTIAIAELVGVPGYPAMFITIATLMAVTTVWYARSSAGDAPNYERKPAVRRPTRPAQHIPAD